MNKTTFCATSCIGENKESFLTDAFETMVGSASWTLRAVFKLHLQATHLAVSSSRPKYLNLNTRQHTKLRARSRQPHLSQGRLERVLINLSGEDRSNLYWDTLTTVYPEKWAQDKNINSTKKLSKKNKKYKIFPLPAIFHPKPAKEESDQTKYFKTISACNFSDLWKENGQGAPQGLADVNEIIHCVPFSVRQHPYVTSEAFI